MPPRTPAAADPENGIPANPAAAAPSDEEEEDGTGLDEEGTSQEPLDDEEEDEDGDGGGEGSDPDAQLTRAEREAEEAAREAEKAALREEVKAELKREADEAARKQAEKAERDRLEKLFPSAVKTVRDNLKGHTLTVKDAEGNDVSIALSSVLSDEQIEALAIKPMNDLHSRVFESTAIQVYGSLATGAAEVLPKDVAEKFTAEADQKELKDWLQMFGESYAEHSTWAKTEAKKHEAAVKEAEAKGQRMGRGLPPKQPTQAEGRSRGPAKTWAQLQAGYGEGTLTGAEEARYEQMRKEREEQK